MKNDISKIFRLQAFWIHKVEVEKESIEISVKLKKQFIKCPHCGKKSSTCHQKGKECKVKHHIWGNTTIFLAGKKNRWKCFRCKKPFTEIWPGLKKWSRKTENAEYQILGLLKGKSFRQLEIDNKVTDREARYLLEKIVPLPNWEEEQSHSSISLGIDEHSFRGRNLVITITNLSQKRLKGILPDDRQKTLRDWIKSIPKPIKSKIKEVCIDMKKSFAVAIGDGLPKAAIVVDHFHVIQDANRRLDEARRLEQEMQKRKRIGKRWWFLMGRERLKEKHRNQLDLLLVKYYTLKEFYYFKEELRTFYKSKNKQEAEIHLSRIISNMECSDDAAIYQWSKTLKYWRNYILNYFNKKTTNAFTEGTHTKIKMIKRMSYGFRNVGIYIRKMMLAFIPITLLGGLIWHTIC